MDFRGCEVRRIVAFTEKPDLAAAQRYMNEGGYCWNSGLFAWKAATILAEINRYLPEAAPRLTEIGEAWNTAARDRVLNETFPRMPTGSIDYKVMQKTRNACSITLACSWEALGTHAALAERIGARRENNVVVGRVVVNGTGNHVLANTEQCVVVASDNMTVVVTNNTVFVGDQHTDMKALVELVAEQEPEIV